MARKKKHEEHVNAEAWAIPYGDLVTLLFALFTVMYAMSSVNEGKFRVLSDSMIAAFHGAPKSLQPINVGAKEPGKGGDKQLVGVSPTLLMKLRQEAVSVSGVNLDPLDPNASQMAAREDLPGSLMRMEREVQSAMQALIDANLVTVKRENMWLEIEINTDILFPSGAADFSTAAEPILDKLAEVLKPFPNPIRVEGHTDNRPIRTVLFPSNWELSAARAASVVHEFTKAGVDPLRLEIVGFGEFHPRQSNESTEGRNANRRVAVLVLEEVSPGSAVTATAGEQTPQSAAPGVEAAEPGGSGNRLLSRVAVGDADKTVLSKGVDTPAHAPAMQAPAQHIGPVDLAWPGGGEVKAPAAAHE